MCLDFWCHRHSHTPGYEFIVEYKVWCADGFAGGFAITSDNLEDLLEKARMTITESLRQAEGLLPVADDGEMAGGNTSDPDYPTGRKTPPCRVE